MDATQKTEKQYEKFSAAARRVGIDARTLRKWAAAGLLRTFRPAGPTGKQLISSAELDALIEGSASRAK